MKKILIFAATLGVMAGVFHALPTLASSATDLHTTDPMPPLVKPIRIHRMWYSRKYSNAPMPCSILFYGGYAVHGTYQLKELGRTASHGCVRLHPQNAKALYRLVARYGMGNTRIVVTQ